MKHFFLICFIVVLRAVTMAQSWTPMNSLPGLPRYGAASTQTTTHGYVLGGETSTGRTTDCWSYEPIGQVWNQIASYPGEPRSKAISFSYNDIVYYGWGDVNGLNDTLLYSYNPMTNEWTEISGAPAGINSWSASCFMIDSKAYIVTFNNLVISYDCINGVWQQHGNFPGPQRSQGSAFALNGAGYFGLGYPFVTPFLNDFWKYDPLNDSWTEIPGGFPGTRRYTAAGAATSNFGYILCGESQESPVFNNDVWRFDPMTETFQQLGNFAANRNYLSRFVLDGTVYAGCGGPGWNTSWWSANLDDFQQPCNTLTGTLQNGLVGYWPFCGNANDESGNGNDGVVNGATMTEDRFGNPGSAYSFDGLDDFIEVSNSQSLQNINSLTIQAWYNVNSWYISDNFNWFPLICKSVNADPAQYSLACRSDGYIHNFNNNLGYMPSNNEINVWVHCAVVSNQDTTWFYENGTLVGTLTNYSILSNISTSANLLFGKDSPGLAEYANGIIDDIGIWNRALTPEEITSLYTGEPVVQPACAQLDPALQQGLVGYWPFCGNANDESGNGNDGVVNGATLTEDRFGNVGSAFEFSEAEQNSIDVGNNPNFNFESNSNFTISLWAKNNSLLSINNEAVGYYLYKGNGGGNNKKWLLGDFATPYSNGDFAYVFHSNDELGNFNWLGDTTTHEPDFIEWNHIVFSREDGVMRVFRNGELINTEIIDNLPNYYNDSNLFFGRGENVTINAKLDDIGIWNRALTAEEIALLYGNFNPQVTGCTDPLAFNYNPQATVNEGCQYTATVFVYNDLNGNGTHETGEPGLTNWPVLGNSISSMLWTNADGNVLLPLTPGAYQFTVINTTDNWVSTTPTSVTIDLSAGPAVASFGLQVIPGQAIVAAGPFNGFWDILHCTDGYVSGVYLENIGSQAVSGFLTLNCDPIFTPDENSYFTTAPSEIGPGYALWNLNDFLPGQFELLSVHVDGPGVEYLNQVFNFDFQLTLFDPQGNMIYSDNWTASPVVSCSYDPNDLTGFPEGLVAPNQEGYTIEHFIRPDHMVEFRVRFQNTGNLPAEDVDIYLPLDPNMWELSTIYPLMRSADAQMICLHDDGTNIATLEHPLPDGVNPIDLLIFNFDDIYLPDSASDPLGSQGYIYFQMQAKHTLNPGDEINEQAFIYFDNNPPIITNETYHVIFDCTSFTPMTGDAELCAGDDLQFSASQLYVDEYAWSINGLEGSSNTFVIEGMEAGDYTLQLNTSNVICPQGENHEVNITVYDLPLLDLPLDATVCEGESITFAANSDGDVTWSNGASTDDSIEATESFTVTATSVGEGGCSVSEDWSVTVNPLPSAAVDNTNNVLTAQDGTSWQWSVNGVDGATTQSTTAAVDGNYQVVVTNEFGCAAESEVIVMDITNSVVDYSRPTLAIYPNPMKDQARLELPKGTCDIVLYDVTGACVRTMPKQQGSIIIDRASLASGVYQVRIEQGSDVTSIRLVVE